MKILNRKIKWQRVLLYIVLISIAILLFFPLYWSFVSAFKGKAELAKYPPTLFPHSFDWENLSRAWHLQPFTLYFFNSVIITIVSVFGMVFSSAIIAYGFARFRFKGKNVMFALLLATMMIPWDVLVIPLYMEYSWAGWIDTWLPLIVPSFFGGGYYIFLLRQFLRTIPKDFEEAAVLEGANQWQVFTKIFLPLMKPQLALIAVLHTIVVWNDYLGPLVYINSQEKFTMAIGLSLFNVGNDRDISSMLMIAVIMSIPTAVAFFTSQKEILNTDMSSGIK